MRINELVVGEFYIIKPTTRKEVIIEDGQLRMVSNVPVKKENRIYRDSLFVYAGQKVEKIEKRVDNKRKEVYTYKPHIMHCVKTGETFRIASYYIQTYFTQPKK